MMSFLEDDRVKGVPLLVFANKQDKPGAASSTEIAERFELSRLTTRQDWNVQPCNVLTDEDIINGFHWMADKLKAKKLQMTAMPV